MLSNIEFVRAQFENFNKHAAYRDVLMLTSFIETAVRSVNKPRKEFKKSLQTLGLHIDKYDEKKSSYSAQCKYKNSSLIETNTLRVQRNELLHDIIKERFPQEFIHQIIEMMRVNIIYIFDHSDLVNQFFKTEYGYETKGILLHKWLKR